MSNKYFPDESISSDDLFFVCYMIERVARRTGHRNKYVIDRINDDRLWHFLSLAGVLHSENPLQVEDEWIKEFNLRKGKFDIKNVRPELQINVPGPSEMAGVYSRLIENTMTPEENYVQAIRRVYSDKLCRTIDNYNCSAFYEPSYVITKAYFDKRF